MKLSTDEAYNIVLDSAEYFGLGHQTMKLCEEMAECSAALLKGTNGDHMIEEIFDVYIVLIQVMAIMNLDISDPVCLRKILKLKGILETDKKLKAKTIVKSKTIKSKNKKANMFM